MSGLFSSSRHMASSCLASPLGYPRGIVRPCPPCNQRSVDNHTGLWLSRPKTSQPPLESSSSQTSHTALQPILPALLETIFQVRTHVLLLWVSTVFPTNGLIISVTWPSQLYSLLCRLSSAQFSKGFFHNTHLTGHATVLRVSPNFGGRQSTH